MSCSLELAGNIIKPIKSTERTEKSGAVLPFVRKRTEGSTAPLFHFSLSFFENFIPIDSVVFITRRTSYYVIQY